MNKEQSPLVDKDPYWHEDVGLFEGAFRYTRNEPTIVRARIHRSDEKYWLDASEREIVPIRERTGIRTYLQLEAYLPLPDIRVTVSTSPAQQRADGAIGSVHSSEMVGMRKQPIGKGQAWYYPNDTTLVLWEAFLETQYQDKPLLEDPNMRRLWVGIEDCLTTRFPEASCITTPFDDPLFETDEYREFLRGLGYEPVATAAYAKTISHA